MTSKKCSDNLCEKFNLNLVKLPAYPVTDGTGHLPVKLGLNYPMDPFELINLTGVDIALHVKEYLYKELTQENNWSALVLLKSMIRAGKLGKKVGQG